MTEKVKYENIPLETQQADFSEITYADGVTVGGSSTEAHFIFRHVGKVKSVVLVPYPVAKSVVGLLAKVIESYEERTGQEIIKVEELNQKLTGSQTKID